MINPRLSVIIPSYNQEQYLCDAIDSVLAQTKEADEIIVVDDGSTDNSLAIARKYGYKIKVISQVNKGLASARNTALMNLNDWTDYGNNADEHWVLPLDADDILLPNAVEKILDAIEKDPHADIIAPSFKTFGTTNQEVIIGDANVMQFLEANRIGYFSAIRKSKLLEIGGYSPRMTWGYEDYHMWINLLNRGAKLVTLKDILVLYRTKTESMITVAQAHHEELMAQIKKDFPELYV